MDIAGRLERIQQEIQTVENEKLQQEQMLGLFWEHPPALDPEAVGRAMQFLRDRIRGLEDRKRAPYLTKGGAKCTHCAGRHPR